MIKQGTAVKWIGHINRGVGRILLISGNTAKVHFLIGNAIEIINISELIEL